MTYLVHQGKTRVALPCLDGAGGPATVTEGQNDFMIWDDLAITYPPQCTINLQTLAYLSQVWQTIFPGNVVVAGTAFTFDGGGGSLP